MITTCVALLVLAAVGSVLASRWHGRRSTRAGCC